MDYNGNCLNEAMVQTGYMGNTQTGNMGDTLAAESGLGGPAHALECEFTHVPTR
jgi:hypothetical protein